MAWIVLGLVVVARAATPCPEVERHTLPLACPEGARVVVDRGFHSCTRADGTPEGPRVHVREGEVTTSETWRDGERVGWSWSGDARHANLLHHLPDGRVDSWTCRDGRALERRGADVRAAWTEDGTPRFETVSEDGRTVRSRAWDAKGRLLRDAVEQGEGSGLGADGKRYRWRSVWGRPVGELSWRSGDERLQLRVEVRDAEAVGARQPLAPPLPGGDEGVEARFVLEMCDAYDGTRAVPHAGLACVGEVVLEGPGDELVGAFDAEGRRHGVWRTRRHRRDTWDVAGWDHGRVLWRENGPGRSPTIHAWHGERFLGVERPLGWTPGSPGQALHHLGRDQGRATKACEPEGALQRCRFELDGVLREVGTYTEAWGPKPLGVIQRFDAEGRLLEVGEVGADGPEGVWTERRPDGTIATGEVVSDEHGQRHRVGLWTVVHEDGTRLPDEHWVRGRPAGGLVRSADQPLPRVVVEPEAVRRLADAVEASGPDDPLPRVCWYVADPAVSLERVRLDALEEARASMAPLVMPPFTEVFAELLRRGSDTPGARACLGDLEGLGPAWSELRDEYLARTTAREAWTVDQAALHDALEVLPRGHVRDVDAAWSDAVPASLDDPAWRGWVRGLLGRHEPRDDAMLPRVRRLVLGTRAIWLVTVPCEQADGSVLACTSGLAWERELLPDDLSHGVPRYGGGGAGGWGRVHLPHTPITSVDVVDGEQLRMSWRTDRGVRTERLSLVPDHDPSSGCTPTRGDRWSWELVSRDLAAPPICQRDDRR